MFVSKVYYDVGNEDEHDGMVDSAPFCGIPLYTLIEDAFPTSWSMSLPLDSRRTVVPHELGEEFDYLLPIEE